MQAGASSYTPPSAETSIQLSGNWSPWGHYWYDSANSVDGSHYTYTLGDGTGPGSADYNIVYNLVTGEWVDQGSLDPVSIIRSNDLITLVKGGGATSWFTDPYYSHYQHVNTSS